MGDWERHKDQLQAAAAMLPHGLPLPVPMQNGHGHGHGFLPQLARLVQRQGPLPNNVMQEFNLLGLNDEMEDLFEVELEKRMMRSEKENMEQEWGENRLDTEDCTMEDKVQGHCDNISIDGDVLSYTGEGWGEGQSGNFVSNRVLTMANNYFEVEILDTGECGKIGIGIVPKNYVGHHGMAGRFSRPEMGYGYKNESITYMANEGKIRRTGKSSQILFVPKCVTGDRMGCGIVADPHEPGQKIMYTIFFTKNGKKIESLHVNSPQGGYVPRILMHSVGEEVRLNQDMDWRNEEVILMSIDDCEDDWARLHDVKLNGHILEYTGKGKTIMDVGLAQARFPLDTMSHYFEIEILDPGENCYIAIGIARKTYPNHRHPGWNRGSIAYHADDGKLFSGSGMGDRFGPKCFKGDVMGCGLLFPLEYNPESDIVDGSPNDNDLPDLISDSDDDYLSDEELWRGEIPPMYRSKPPKEDDGTTVQIFFTRNGKTIGRQSMNIPKGGFYPTVGMLSSHEKVKVDLRPLTG